MNTAARIRSLRSGVEAQRMLGWDPIAGTARSGGEMKSLEVWSRECKAKMGIRGVGGHSNIACFPAINMRG